MTDLAACAGDENDGFAHARLYFGRIIAALCFSLFLSCSRRRAPIASNVAIDTLFTGETMRVDYFHTGGPKSGETILARSRRQRRPLARKPDATVDPRISDSIDSMCATSAGDAPLLAWVRVDLR